MYNDREAVSKVAMNRTELFAAEQNVWHFIDRLAHEQLPHERDILTQLLRNEMDRFAKGVERLEAKQRWIQKCDRHIARNTALLDKVSAANRALLEGNRGAMEEIRETLVSIGITWRHHDGD
jgi:DNA-binding transcriptional regulator GbsR (MarR family)